MPHATDEAASRGTSLQALQAIENEVSTDEERISHINKILQNDRQIHYGRHEWVAKWLLKKLKNFSDDDAARFRNNSNVWQLLSRLISEVPAHAFARLFGHEDLVSIVSQTLQKNASRNGSILRAVPVDVDQSIFHAEFDLEELGKTSTDSSRASSKRKSPPSPEQNISKKPKLDKSRAKEQTHPGHHDVFPDLGCLDSMALCIKTLIAKSDELASERDAFSAESVQVLLQARSQTCYEFLSNWIRASSNYIWKAISQSSDARELLSTLSRSPAMDMSWVLRIWLERSSKQSPDDDDDGTLFVKLCSEPISELIPLARTAAQCLELQSVFDKIYHESLGLIARLVIIPARTKYFHTATEKANDNSDVLGWLNALRSFLDDERTLSVHSSNPRLILTTLPLIYRAAIACTPLTGPRKVTSASAWLEAAFKELLACAKIVATHQKTKSEKRDTSGYMLTLQILLQLSNKHRLKFSKAFLQEIAVDFGGLFEEKPKNIDRITLSLITNMDASLFVNRQRTDPKKSSAETSLATAYFKNLSQVDMCIETGVQSIHPDVDIAIGEVKLLANEFAKQRDLKQFVYYWHAELARNMQHKDNSEPPSQSLWETANMAVLIKSMVGTSITRQQWLEIFEERSELLVKACRANRLERISEQQDLFANICITTLLLHAVEDDKQAVTISPQIDKVRTATLAALKSDHHNLRTRSKLWQLFAITNSLMARSKASGLDVQYQNLLITAKLIDKNLKNTPGNLTANKKDEIISSVTALCDVGAALTNEGDLASEGKNLLKDLLISLITVVEETKELPESIAPDLMLLFAQSPHILRLCHDNELSERYTRAFFNVTHIYRYDLISGVRTISSPWELMLQNIRFVDNGVLKSITSLFQTGMGLEQGKTTVKVDLDLLGKLSKSYLDIDADLIPKKQRDHYLNVVASSLAHENQTDGSTIASIFSAVLKFVQNPAGNTPTAWDIGQLSHIGKNLDKRLHDLDEITTDNLLAIWERICLHSIRRHANDISSDDDQQSEDLCSLTAKYQDGKASFKFTKCLAYVCVSDDKQAKAPPRGLVKALRKLGEDACTIVLKETRRLKKSPASEGLNSLVNSLELLSVFGGEALLKITDIEPMVDAIQKHQDNKNAPRSLFFNCCIIDCKLRLARRDSLNTSLISSIFSSCYTTAQKSNFKLLLRQCLVSVPMSDYNDIIKRQVTLCEMHDSDSGGWDLLGELMSLADMLDSSLEAECLSSIITLCCRQMRRSSNVERLNHSFTIAEKLLLSAGKTLLQSSVDDLLGSLASMLSPESPDVPHAYASVLYMRICKVLHSVLSLHNKRWRGRFNLVLPVLQSLLRCLFYTASGSSRTDKRLLRPRWLQNDGSASSSLTVKHAELLARLLTATCEPSASSVAARRKDQRKGNPSLVDETKKAREYAGQHVHLVLTEFCHVQLIGRLPDGVRKALMPGLFACFNVMTEKSIKAQMDGLDSGARVVFRGLWDEWNKVGK